MGSVTLGFLISIAMIMAGLRSVVMVLASASLVTSQNVLVVYTADSAGSTEAMARSVASGAASVGATTKVRLVSEARYDEVRDWADVVALGSGVINGNADPALLEFIQYWTFGDDMTAKVGTSFATGASAAAGLQTVVEQLNRALFTFRMVMVGGSSWRVSEGAAAVIGDAHWNATLQEASDQGARASTVAAALAAGATPAPKHNGSDAPPGFGDEWTAAVSANMTSVGYDAGLVIVNFTSSCRDPGQQKMKTVYGDSYTVLTRCDMGREFTIAPASRGSECHARVIGVDVAARICDACGCPFCVRDTNGSYVTPDATSDSSGSILWESPRAFTREGRDLVAHAGVAVAVGAGDDYSLKYDLAFDDKGRPAFINVTHPLWISTAARVDGFSNTIPPDAFDIPKSCYN